MVDEFLKHLLVCDKCLQENKYNIYPHENIQRFTVVHWNKNAAQEGKWLAGSCNGGSKCV